MKTPLLYGFLSALAGMVLTLLLFFTGFHDSPEKMKSAGWVGGSVSIAITVTFLALAMRDKRVQAPADAEWGYGSAFGAGVLTALIAAVFSAIFMCVYIAFINPGYSDIVWMTQQAGMEAKGNSASQIAAVEPLMRKIDSPIGQACIVLILGSILSTIIALIVAIFFKNPRPATPGAEPAPAA